MFIILALTLDDLTSQATVFFLVGFDTATTVTGFACLEMAVNNEIKRKAQLDIDEALSNHGGKLNYEALKEMKYLECIIQGNNIGFCLLKMTMKFTIIFQKRCENILLRECRSGLAPKTIPFQEQKFLSKRAFSSLFLATLYKWTLNISQTPKISILTDLKRKMLCTNINFCTCLSARDLANALVKFEIVFFAKITIILCRIFHPVFFFFINIFITLYFIGSRFAMLQLKMALAAIISKFDLSVCERTIFPAQIDPRQMVVAPLGGVWLQVQPRSSDE